MGESERRQAAGVRVLTPQLYLVDYCSWLVCGLVVLAIPLPFVGVYSTVPMSAGATAIIAATAAGSLAIILLRGHRARRKAKDIARRDNAWTLVFDHAQLHDMRGSPLRDIDGGVLWVDSVGTVRVWATNGDETLGGDEDLPEKRGEMNAVEKGSG